MKKEHKNIESNIIDKVRRKSESKNESEIVEKFDELVEQFTNFMIFLNCHEEVHRRFNEN